MMLPDKNKLNYLEGVRGLAAIIVVLHHFTLLFFPALNTGDPAQAHFGNGSTEVQLAGMPLNILYNGGFAVSMFFVLSGFVLSNTYQKTHNTTILTRYAVKRYVRLFVPVSVSIAIAWIFMKTGVFSHFGLGEVTKSQSWLEENFKNNEGFFHVIKNMFIDVFFRTEALYNPVLWTMTYELLGSFLIFAFLLIIHPLNYKTGLYLLLVFVLFASGNNFYAAFVGGALLSRIFVVRRALIPAIFNQKLLLLVVCLIGLFLCSYPFHTKVNETMYRYITFSFMNNYEVYHVIGSIMLLFALLQSQTAMKLLSGKPLVYIGKISFSFYLLHFIILCSFSCYLFKLFYPSYTYASSVALAFLCSLPVIILTAVLYQKYIDRSGILLSEKIAGYFTRK